MQLEGWTGVQNGELLSRIDGRFDVLILADKILRYQQKLTGRKIALVELPTNRWPIIRIMAERIVDAVENALPGSYTILEPRLASTERGQLNVSDSPLISSQFRPAKLQVLVQVHRPHLPDVPRALRPPSSPF